MKQTFIINVEIKKSAFTVLMLESLGWKLVDIAEVGMELCGVGCDEHTMRRYNRLEFQRALTEKSDILF